MGNRRSRARESGFTLIELLIVVAIIGIVAAAAIPALQRAMLKSKIGRLANDARTLEKAFIQFHMDNGMFPSTSSPPARALNKRTLDPLVSSHYLTTAAAILDSLDGRQITDYDSPNNGSADAEYWAILTLAALPSIQVVVADTTDLPGFTGQQVGGCYFLVNGALLPLDDNVLVRLGK